MKIEVWSDFVCPFCYIGKRRLEQAIEHFDHKDKIVINYKSYELNPDAEKSLNESIHEILAKKYNMPIEQAKKMNDNVASQAKEVGLEYNFDIMKHANTFDAHRVAKVAAKEGKENEMVERLLKAYFTEGKQISDHETLIMLAKEVGLDPGIVQSVLESRKYSAYVRDDEEQAAQIGVQGVPFFVFNEKYAVSGAHPPEVFKEVLEKVWQEENENPVLQTLTPKGSETSYCTDEGCQGDQN
ncbi:MAG TPA: DsbA family oxidoreductase [Candidatus Avamphibacillus sp.]|nr:DsbA family oxidoreductase [Candidatus Avamphibacillus sp.]